MTEDELKAIEAVAIRRIKQQPDWSTDGNDLLRLVAEVARLKGLIERAEWVAEDVYGDSQCPYCGAIRIMGGRGLPPGTHEAECSAFTESGDVR